MNHYNIVKQIGKGTFSAIYHVTYQNRDYAMKKVNLTGITNNQKKYILSELKIISEHKSDYIIKFYDAFVKNDNLCIIMEYCSKGTLESYLKRNCNLKNDKIWKYFSQLCGSVLYLHNNNIIHRDLKTANILIDSQDNIKLIDFGVSKILNNYMKFTRSFVGTTYCMSPELLKNSFYDHKTDIWGLGIILYQMTHNGKIPFQCKNIDQLRKNINKKIEINDNINGAFKIIINKCIQLSPHKRIKLDVLVKHSEIKKNLKGNLRNTKTIHQIDKVPTYEKEWMNIVNNIPNQLPTPSPVEKIKREYNLEFMQHYSKDNLVHLNTRLINIITEKNMIILQLHNEIKELRQLKLDLS